MWRIFTHNPFIDASTLVLYTRALAPRLAEVRERRRQLLEGGFRGMNGSVMTDAAMWRPGVTRGQLMRAAVGLEAIADTCAGRRRDELLEMADGLRERAWTGRPDAPGGSRPRAPRHLRAVR
jgi:hypothetical protein